MPLRNAARKSIKAKWWLPRWSFNGIVSFPVIPAREPPMQSSKQRPRRGPEGAGGAPPPPYFLKNK